MGTRNLTAVYSGGAYRIAQYGQWDGYPEGQGRKALEFCREHLSEPFGRAAFAARCALLRFVTADDSARVEAHGDNWKHAFPHLSRDAGAKILSMVADNDDVEFLADSLECIGEGTWCEWAWCIDLDANVLEAWEVNASPGSVLMSQRWRDLKSPMYLVGSWPLDALPSDEEFLAHFAKGEES